MNATPSVPAPTKGWPRRRLRVLFYAVALLFLAWFTLPWWLPPVAKYLFDGAAGGILPAGVRLQTLKVARPGFSRWRIIRLRLQAANARVQLEHISVGYFPGQTLTIGSAKLTRIEAPVPAAATLRSSLKLPPLPAPISPPRPLHIEKLLIVDGHQQLQLVVDWNAGTLTANGYAAVHRATAKTSSLDPVTPVSQRWPVALKVQGLDRRRALSVELGLQPQGAAASVIRANMVWPTSGQPGVLLKLDVLITPPLWQWVAPWVDAITLEGPRLEFHGSAQWPQWPMTSDALAQVRLISRAQLAFDAAQFGPLYLAANQFQLALVAKPAVHRGTGTRPIPTPTLKLSYNSIRPLQIEYPVAGKRARVSVATNAVQSLKLSTDGLVGKHLPSINVLWQDQHLHLDLTDFQLDFKPPLAATRKVNPPGRSPRISLGIHASGSFQPFKIKPLLRLLGDGASVYTSDVVRGKFSGTLRANQQALTLNMTQLELTAAAVVLADTRLENLHLSFKPHALTLPLPFTAAALAATLAAESVQLGVTSTWTHANLGGELAARIALQPGQLSATLKLSSGKENVELSATSDSTFAKIHWRVRSRRISYAQWPWIENLPAGLDIKALTAQLDLAGTLRPDAFKRAIGTTDSRIKATDFWLRQLDPGSTLVVNSINASYQKMLISNAAATLKVGPRQRWQMSAGVGTVRTAATVAVKNIAATTRLDSLVPLTLTGSRITFDALNGRAELKRHRFIYGRKPQMLVLAIRNLSLKALSTALALDSFSATGRINVRIPLQISTAGVALRDGVIEGVSKGVIHYQSGSLARGNIALAALQNLQYHELSGQFSYSLKGYYHLKLRVIGDNPDVYQGLPVAINPDIKGHLPKLFWGLFVTGEFEKSLLKGIQEKSPDAVGVESR